MTPGGDGSVELILRQTATILGRAGGVIADGTEKGARLYQTFLSVHETVSQGVWYGLLPIGFVLLVLHEQADALQAGRVPRVMPVAVRTIGVICALLAYDRICGLIMGVAGAGGGWLSWDSTLSLLDNGRLNPLHYSYADTGLSVSAVGKLLLMLVLWAFLMLAILFSYIVGALLAMVQAAYLTIILAAGPMCIAVSLVPGVGVARSWARALATTAAWSFFAGIISSLLAVSGAGLVSAVSQAHVGEMLRGTAHFVILGLCTAAVPVITARVLAGAAPSAAAVVGALGTAWLGARAVTAVAGGVRHGLGAAAGAGQGASRPGPGGRPHGLADDVETRRPHKLPMPARVSAAVVGAAAAPVVASAGLLRRAARPVTQLALAPVAAAVRAFGGRPAVIGAAAPARDPDAAISSPAREAAPALDRHDPAPAPASAPTAPGPLTRGAASHPPATAPGDAADPGGERLAARALREDPATSTAIAATAVAAAAASSQRSSRGPTASPLAGAAAPPSASPRAATVVARAPGASPGPTPVGAAGAGDAHRPIRASAAPPAGAAAPAAAVSPAPRAAASAAPAPASPVADPQAAITARQYPLDAPTPIALRAARPHQVSPNVVRRARTQEQTLPPPLRGEEDPDA